MRMRAAVPVTMSALLLLAGCGGSSPAGSTSTAAADAAAVRSQKLAATKPPAPRPARGPSGPDDVCHVVTAADARRWSSVPEVVQKATNEGSFTRCNMVIDADRDALSLDWTFTKHRASLRSVVRDAAKDNHGRRTTLRLSGGVPAVRFDPEHREDPRVVLYTRYQGVTIEVDAYLQVFNRSLSVSGLRRAARELADVYARAGARGTPPPPLTSTR